MPGLNLQLDASQMQQAQEYLVGLNRALPKVQERALNKTIRGVRTDASKSIRKDITAKAKYIKRTMRIIRASAAKGRLVAGLESAGSALPLAAYSVRQTKKGVSVRVKKHGGRSVIPHAFITNMKSGHRGVFQRKYRDENAHHPSSRISKKRDPGQYAKMPPKYRTPVQEKFGPSVPSIFGRPRVMRKVRRKANDRLRRTFDQELNYMLHKTGRSVEHL